MLSDLINETADIIWPDSQPMSFIDGIYENDNKTLVNVICGCCGGIFEANEVTIIRTLDWLSISEEIIGE